MTIILTGPKGNLAYWAAQKSNDSTSAFGMQGRFRHARKCGFARLSAFGANGNHAPTGMEGAITTDLGLEMLFNIAGAC